MKTIKTDTHLLLVDETAEIKENTNTIKEGLNGDWYWNSIYNSISRIGDITDFDFKIIAASPKLGDLPEFEKLPPNVEDDVEKLHSKAVVEVSHFWTLKYSSEERRQLLQAMALDFGVNMYKEGYKQAKSETGFSLEDIRKEKTRLYHILENYPQLNGGELKDEIINKILTKPKEYKFVVEMEEKDIPEDNELKVASDGGYYSKPTQYRRVTQPKIVNNKIQGTWQIKN